MPATAAAAAASHFICSRSVPRERRKRRTRLTAAPAMANGTTISADRAKPMTVSSLSMPSGFTVFGNELSDHQAGIEQDRQRPDRQADGA